MKNRIRLLVAFVIFLLFQASIWAQSVTKVQGYAEKGGQVVQTSPTVSYETQQSFPSSTLTVYLKGTLTLATIYSNDSGTLKSNPFTISSDGNFAFYVANGRYDLKFSGTGIPTPFTWSDVFVGSGIAVATNTTFGTIRLSAAATDPNNPIAVGINDPKLNFLGNFTKSALLALASPRQGDFAQVTDSDRGFWYYTGNLWKQFNGYTDIKDFGAIGDGIANDSPAINTALNLLRTLGGGTLFIPAGKFKMASSGSWDFTGCNIKIRGIAGRSQILPATGASVNMWQFLNAESIELEDITLVGNNAVSNDCATMLSFNTCQTVYLTRVDTYGIANVLGGSLINLNNCDGVINDVGFYGCSAASHLNAGLINSTNWVGIHVNGAKMKDFGSFNGVFYSKTFLEPPLFVVAVDCPTGTGINFTSTQIAEFRNINIDEGVVTAIYANCDRGAGKSIKDLYADNIMGNVGNIGNSMVSLIGVDNADLNRIHAGYSTAGGNMLYANDCQSITLRNSNYTNAAGGIVLANDTYIQTFLTIFDSVFSSLTVQFNGKGFSYWSKGRYYANRGLAPATYSFATLSTIPAELGTYENFYVDKYLIGGGVLFASLGSPANGRMVWCPDCTEADPCAGSGTGSWAKRQNGRWKCN